MKRVKLMLTAITVLAVVGGALAFSAKKFTASVYCTTSDAGPIAGTDDCKLIQQLTYTPNSNGSSYCTTVVNTACAVKAVTAFHP